MADTNMFEQLQREKSSPAVEELETLNTPISGRTSESSPIVQVKSGKLESGIPDTAHQEQHAPLTPKKDPPSESHRPATNKDMSAKTVSYAEAAKGHKDAAGDKFEESAQAAKQSALEAGRAAQAKTSQVGQEVSEVAQDAKAKASETADATREKVGQAAQATKYKAEEVGEAAREKAGEAAAVTKAKAEEASQAAKEFGIEAKDAVKDFAQVAGDKASEMTSAAGNQMAEAAEYVKEHVHLPRVERAESSPEEREVKALLDEARALGEGDTSGGVSYYQPRPELYTTSQAAAPSTTSTAGIDATVAPAKLHDVAGVTKEAAQDAVNDMLDSAAQADRRVEEGKKRALFIHKPTSATGGPIELTQREQREEVSAKGPLQAIAEKAKEAVGYVRDHILPATEDKVSGSIQQAAESTKKAGDDAAENAGQVVEEAKGKTEEAAQEGKQQMDRVAQTTHATGQQLSNQSMGAVHAVEEKASQAYRATVDTVSGAAHSVADQASQTYNATTNAATGAYTAVADKVQEAEEKAKWTVEHTKEKLKESQEEWQREMEPRTVEEALLSHGEVPTNTEDILRENKSS